MGCTKCGPDTKLIELLIEKALNDGIESGKLQAGLRECGTSDDTLPKGSRVVLCNSLGKMICELVKEGEVCFTKPAMLDYDKTTGKLKLALSDGEILETTIEVQDSEDKFLKSVEFNSVTGIAKFHMDDNATTHELDLSAWKPKTTISVEKRGDGAVVITREGKPDIVVDPVKVKATQAINGDVTITNQDGTEVQFKPVILNASAGLSLDSNGGLRVAVDRMTMTVQDGKLKAIPVKHIFASSQIASNLNTLKFGDETSTDAIRKHKGVVVTQTSLNGEGLPANLHGANYSELIIHRLPDERGVEGDRVTKDELVQTLKLFNPQGELLAAYERRLNTVARKRIEDLQAADWSAWQSLDKDTVPETPVIPRAVTAADLADNVTIFDVNGKLSARPRPCIEMTELTTTSLSVLPEGYTCFTINGGAVGVPKQWDATTATQGSNTAKTTSTRTFNGYITKTRDGALVTLYEMLGSGYPSIGWSRNFQGSAAQTPSLWSRETNIDVPVAGEPVTEIKTLPTDTFKAGDLSLVKRGNEYFWVDMQVEPKRKKFTSIQTRPRTIDGIDYLTGNTVTRGVHRVRFAITNNFVTPATDVRVNVISDAPVGASLTVTKEEFARPAGITVTPIDNGRVGEFNIQSLPAGTTELEFEVTVDTPVGNRQRFALGVISYTNGSLPRELENEERLDVGTINTGVTKDVV